MSKKKSSKYKGVWLYFLKNNDITYYITYKNNNKTIWVKVGKKSEGVTEKKAFDYKNNIMLKNRAGGNLTHKNYKYTTFNEIAEYYFDSSMARCKSNKKYRQMYDRHIYTYIGTLKLSELSSRHIYKIQAIKKEEGLSESTINIIIKLIKRIINFAIKEAFISFDPFINVKLFKINNNRLRFLSIEEINKLYSVIKDDKELYLFVKLCLTTGARANSVLSLKKKDIDLINKNITLQDFKRSNTYIGYIDEEAYKILDDRISKISPNTKIINNTYQQVYTKLTKVFKIFNKGLDRDDRANKVVIHTLRHTFASHLALNGVTVQRIQKLMNHKDISQTMKYAKLMPDTGRDNIENLYNNKSIEIG